VLRQFLTFCAVGAVGFVADSGALVALTQVLGIHYLGGRLLSFLFAASITWALNSGLTFKASHRERTWLPYVLTTGLGAAINITVYQIWILYAGTTPGQLIAGVAVGSMCALSFNFAMSRHIFSGHKDTP
jgi:putative flippase GtrA